MMFGDSSEGSVSVSWWGEMNMSVVVAVMRELTGRLGSEVNPSEFCRPFGHKRYENVNDE